MRSSLVARRSSLVARRCGLISLFAMAVAPACVESGDPRRQQSPLASQWVGCAEDYDCAGGLCVDGICVGKDQEAAVEGAAAVMPLAAMVDPPVQVSGGTPATSCLIQNELAPERPWAVPPGDAKLFAGYQSFQYEFSHNWAADWNAWDPGVHVPPPPLGWDPLGDAWSTTSRTGLNYESTIFVSPGGATCVGVGAAQTGNLDGVAWDYPLQCANPLDADFDDGPMIAMDHYSAFQVRMWIVATELNTGGTPQCTGAPQGAEPQVCLYIYDNCTTAPGRPGCLLTASRFVTSDVIDHASVAVDPFNHYGVVAFRNAADGDLEIRRYSSIGQLLGGFLAASGPAFGPVTGCAGTATQGFVPTCHPQSGGSCGGAGCWRIGSKPSLAIKRATSPTTRTLLYVAYDERCTAAGTDGQTHYKAMMRIWDVTNWNAPFQQNMYQSSSCSQPSNEFLSNVSASDSSNNVGYFYYQQPNDSSCSSCAPRACETRYVGQVSSSLGTSGVMTSVQLSSGSFPSILYTFTNGLGHYVAPVGRGLSGGFLYPTWAEPVATSSNDAYCPTCQQAGRMSLRVMGTRVLP